MESRQRQLVLGGLVVAHVVGGVVAACFVKFADEPRIAWFIFTGLIQTQVGLLATWAGVSTMKWPWRLLGTLIGASWLSGLIAVGQLWPYTLGSLPASLLQVALPFFLILVVLVPVRLGGLTLRLTSSTGTDKAVGGTQFSIRTLFVLTAAVAIALAIYDVTSRMSVLHQQAALFSIRLLPMTLAAVWATLIAGLSVLRFSAVVSCWIVFGVLPEPLVAIIRFWATDFWRHIPTMLFFFVPIATFMHTTILLATLLTIRSCGYRLVRSTEGVA